MTRDEIRSHLAESSLSLRGVAAALRRLSNDLDGLEADAAVILTLLARDVDREAETTGAVEAFLNATPREEAR